jgi:hypothetical protein
MKSIKDLTKGELIQYNQELVSNLLRQQGYSIRKIYDTTSRTEYNISKDSENYLIQVKGYRYNENATGNYAWILKHLFDLNEYDFLYFVMYLRENAHILKIPSNVFINPRESSPFKNRDYVNGKSKPEYGIVMNDDTIPQLLQYEVKLNTKISNIKNVDGRKVFILKKQENN